MNPWGLGRTFGGEAESRFVTMNPDACQVLDDGRRVAAACLNNPRYRCFCAEWADAALDAGADLVFWDEPHWVVPEHVGVDDARALELPVRRLSPSASGATSRRNSTTRCSRSARRRSSTSSASSPRTCARAAGATPSACSPRSRARTACRTGTPCGASGRRRLRDRSLLEELRRGGRPVRSALREAPRRDGEPPRCRVRALGPRVPPHGGRHPRPRGRGDAARAAGVERVWVWGYEACAHMSHLATPDSLEVWERAPRCSPRRRSGSPKPPAPTTPTSTCARPPSSSR